MTYDITRRRARETADVELTDGDGSPLFDDDGKPLSVTLCGPASKTWQQADAERSRKQAQRAEKNPRKIASSIAEHRRQDEIDFLVAITISFNNWDYPGEFDTKADRFRAAYSDDAIGFIRDQMTREGNGWSAFTGASSKTSSESPGNTAG